MISGERAARAVLRAKLALEQTLIRPLGQACFNYAAALAGSEGNLSLWDQVAHQQAFEQVLQAHYARVLMSMAGRVGANDGLDHAAANQGQAERLRARAHSQARRIMIGIERDFRRAMTATHPALEAKADGGGPAKPSFTMQYVGKFAEALKKTWTAVKSKLKTIANVETQEVAEQAQVEWVEQEHANSRIHKTWHSLMDGRERQWHHDAHNTYQTSIPVTEPFSVGPDMLKHPGDTSLGASLANIINCFPAGTRVSGDITAATRHWYDGDLVEITLMNGQHLAGTPNHPVLTPEGWISLGCLYEGGYVVCDAVDVRHKPARSSGREGLDVADVEPGIEEVFDALERLSVSVRVPRLAVDFHGDRPTQDVDVVRANGSLRFGRQSASLQHPHELGLAEPRLDQRLFLPERLAALLNVAGVHTATSGVGSPRNGLSRFDAGVLEAQEVGFGTGSRLDTIVSQHRDDHWPTTPHFTSHRQHGLARPVTPENFGRECRSPLATSHAVGLAGRTSEPGPLDYPMRHRHRNAERSGQEGHTDAVAITVQKISALRVRQFAGHVYNLQSVHGLYHANGVVVHNCRCSAHYSLVRDDGTTIDLPIRTPSLPAKRPWREGDRFGKEIPVTPTETVTLNGKTRARIVLGDGKTFATMRQERPDLITVTVNGKPVARASVSGPDVTSLTIAPEYANQDIERLIRDSVKHSHDFHASRARAH